MNPNKTLLAAAAASVAVAGVAPLASASSHREAPVTALDRAADITDVYAFVSYDGDQTANETPEAVTLIMCVDPLLEPANGPTRFPFDPDITYRINVDNDRDAEPDVTFEVRFSTEFQLPGVPVALIGINDGANDPETGDLAVPPMIDSFDDPGLNLRQTYTVTMVRDTGRTVLGADDDGPLYAVPADAGPRTTDYEALYDAGTYDLDNGVRSFAGTVDDPFYIDLGAAFDTVNFRTLGSGVPGVLTADEDSALQNFASDTVSGYAVNAIAIEVPIEMLTSTGAVEPATSDDAVIGVYATTSRPRVTIRRSPRAPVTTSRGDRQVQRLANPLINELIIGIGTKDFWSRSDPADDGQFADTYLNPVFPQAVEAIYNDLLPSANFDVPEGPRNDLLPLVQYRAPIAPDNDTPGPVADLLRLNTGVPATPIADASRLGAIAGDLGGFPNGRRLFDDATDIALRVVVGGVLADQSTFNFQAGINDMLGDGVNINATPTNPLGDDAFDEDGLGFRTEFPYLANSPSGRNRRHVDPGEQFPDGSGTGTVPID